MLASLISRGDPLRGSFSVAARSARVFLFGWLIYGRELFLACSSELRSGRAARVLL